MLCSFPQLLLTSAADGLTIPQLNIQRKDIPDNDTFKFIDSMGAGWNLGNTFDAYNNSLSAGANLSLEYAWCGKKTTKAHITAIKNEGYNTIRIPVSWHNHVDSNFTINQQWLARVKEVVDYARDNDMYVIINIHHDNEEAYMFPDSEHLDNSKNYVRRIWEQVADYFKNYDEHLIFETLNEPRLVGSTYEWNFISSSTKCKTAQDCINQYNQVAVDAIRAAGGNNANRYIIVPAYCAKTQAATSSLLTLPTDAAENKIIVSIHEYIPYNFALNAPSDSASVSTFDMNGSDGQEITTLMNKLYNKFVSKNIPVVITEFGARNKSENTQARIDYAAYYYATARANGITCCWWDNNSKTSGEAFGIFNRTNNTFHYPLIADASVQYGKSAGGFSGDHTHNYTSAITTPATCTTAGVRTYTCSNCEDTYTEVIEKIAHNYVETVVAPTTTEQGYTLHKCSVCGDSYKDNYVDPIDVPVVRPKYIKSTISLEGVIGANLEYKISDTYVNGNYKIEVTAVSDKGDTKELTFDKNEKVGTNYKVVLPVTSSELTHVYDVTLAVKDASGNVITSVTNKVTVNATLNQMRSDEEVGPLARALQTYGTYAQKYFGVGTTVPTEEPDDISGITNEDLAAYKLSQQAVTTAKKVKFGTQSLLLEDQTTIRVTLASVPTTVDVNKLEMVYTGGEKEGRTEVKYDASTGKYYADISNISAQELSVMYSIHMEEAGEQVSNNLSYGAYSFIQANVSSNDVNYSNALKALYNYGEAAKEYFN